MMYVENLVFFAWMQNEAEQEMDGQKADADSAGPGKAVRSTKEEVTEQTRGRIVNERNVALLATKTKGMIMWSLTSRRCEVCSGASPYDPPAPMKNPPAFISRGEC